MAPASRRLEPVPTSERRLFLYFESSNGQLGLINPLHLPSPETASGGHGAVVFGWIPRKAERYSFRHFVPIASGEGYSFGYSLGRPAAWRATAARWASSPRPLLPCLSVETR